MVAWWPVVTGAGGRGSVVESRGATCVMLAEWSLARGALAARLVVTRRGVVAGRGVSGPVAGARLRRRARPPDLLPFGIGVLVQRDVEFGRAGVSELRWTEGGVFWTGGPVPQPP